MNGLYTPKRSKVKVLKNKKYIEDKIEEKMLHDSVNKFLNHETN
tara:strand:+ start:140 stop:271 length:132 start_codon:yes stop_codon:yes gene_type:complete